MSGLALYWHLDGRPANAGDLDAMLTEMARRGPDGERREVSGSAALGHRLLVTTPEAANEPMPFRDALTGRWITGEIRLDNRPDLIARFGLAGVGRVVGDGELVLRAFAQWGEDCALHLLGDFAFAIWDPAEHYVFAARDHTGMRQIIYSHHSGKAFICASSALAVARAHATFPPLNQLKLARALIDSEAADFESTFFNGVLRLPPAHCLIVDRAGLRLRRYWEMTPPAPLLLRSDEDYADAFRDVLAAAVRDRLRGQEHIGAMLSGGMDSGSIVALASGMMDRPLPTFSVIGPHPSIAREVEAIRAASGMDNLAPHFIDYSQMGALLDPMIEQARSPDEPFDIYFSAVRACYLSAAGQGLKVVFDGASGDTVLHAGLYLPRLLRDGRLVRFFGDIMAMRRHYETGPAFVLRETYGNVRRAFWPRSLKFWSDAKAATGAGLLPENALISPEFARTSGLLEELAAAPPQTHPLTMSPAEERIRIWEQSGLTVGRERYDRVAAACGIEPRDPYMDKRMLEFWLSLPHDALAADGHFKIVQRRAMAGLMPDSVRWSVAKEHPGGAFTREVFRKWPGWPGQIHDPEGALAGLLTPQQCAQAAALDDPLPEAAWDPTRSGLVAVFLRHMAASGLNVQLQH